MDISVSDRILFGDTKNVLASNMVSEGTPQPLVPSTRLYILVPNMTPMTAPVSSSIIGPPLDPAVGNGENKR